LHFKLFVRQQTGLVFRVAARPVRYQRLLALIRRPKCVMATAPFSASLTERIMEQAQRADMPEAATFYQQLAKRQPKKGGSLNYMQHQTSDVIAAKAA
jgi:hypothetical protein